MENFETNTVIFRDKDGELKFISPEKIIANVKIIFKAEGCVIDIRNTDGIPLEYNGHMQEILNVLSSKINK